MPALVRSRLLSTLALLLLALYLAVPPAAVADIGVYVPPPSPGGSLSDASTAPTGTLLREVRTSSLQAAAASPGAGPGRILVIGPGIQQSLFPDPSLPNRISGTGAAADLTDPHGYGTLVASAILQVLPNAEITSRAVSALDANWTALNLSGLASALSYAHANRTSFDAVLLALPPAGALDPYAYLAGVNYGARIGGGLALLAEAIMENPAETNPPMAGVPLDLALRNQVFAKANARQRDAVEKFAARVAEWEAILAPLADLAAAGVAIVAPAGDLVTKDSAGAQIPVYPQSVYGLSARPEVITVGASYRHLDLLTGAITTRVSPASGAGPSLSLRPKPDLIAPADLLGLVPNNTVLAKGWPKASTHASNATTLDWAGGVADTACASLSGGYCALQGSSLVAAAVGAANLAATVASGTPSPAASRTGDDEEVLLGLAQAAASLAHAKTTCSERDLNPPCPAAGDVRDAYPWEEGAGELQGLLDLAAYSVPVPVGRAAFGELAFGAGASRTLPLWSGGAAPTGAQAALSHFAGAHPSGEARTGRWTDPGVSASLGPNGVTVSLAAGSYQGGFYAGALTLVTDTTTRASVSGAGLQADGASAGPAISADGRYVAFASGATNLEGSDTNAAADIFVRDRKAGATKRISVASDGTQASGASSEPSISADGRYVAFTSAASNLVAGDTNGAPDIFLRDRDTDADGVFDEAGAVATTRVSVSSSGAQASGASSAPAISGDGRYVAFSSLAADLVSGDANGVADVFVFDRLTAQTVRVSVSSSGAEGNGAASAPSLSGDGRYVAFASAASNLVTGDANGVSDVFVHDLVSRTTSRIEGSQGEGNGASTEPAVSADGRYLAFASAAANLDSADTNGVTDVFLHDRDTDADAIFDEPSETWTFRISVSSSGAQANGASSEPAISATGARVAFASAASNLVTGDANGAADIFLRDGAFGPTTRASVSSAGLEAAGASGSPALSATGRFVAFSSEAANLVGGDTNAAADVFVRDSLTGSWSYPVSVVRDQKATFHADYVYSERNTAAFDRREGERVEDATVALMPALPVKAGLVSKTFRFLQEHAPAQPLDQVVRFAVTKGGQFAAQTAQEVGTAVIDKVPPGYWRFYLISDYSLPAVQARGVGDGLGVAPGGGGPEVATVPGATLLVSSVAACAAAQSALGPLTEPCLSQDTSPLEKDPATGFCKLTSPTWSYWLYCGDAPFAAAAQVSSRAVHLIEYDQDPAQGEWKTCAADVPLDGTEVDFAALVAQASGPVCHPGQTVTAWTFRSLAPDCLAPTEKQAYPSGHPSDVTATYDYTLVPGSVAGANLSVGVLTYTFNLPTPNTYATIELNFSYKTENAVIAMMLSGTQEGVGDSAGSLVIAGDAALRVDPLLTVATTKGSVHKEWSVISGGSGQASLSLLLIPTTWIQTPLAAGLASVQICAPALKVKTRAKQVWGDAVVDAATPDPVQKLAQANAPVASQIQTTDQRTRARFNATSGQFDDVGAEREDLVFAVAVPKDTTRDPRPAGLEPTQNWNQVNPDQTGGPAYLFDLRRADTGQPLAGFKVFDPALGSNPIGACNVNDPEQAKAQLCQQWRTAQKRLDLTDMWMNGRFFGSLPLDAAAIAGANRSVVWVAADADDHGAFNCRYAVVESPDTQPGDPACASGRWDRPIAYPDKFTVSNFYGDHPSDGLNGSQTVIGGWVRVSQGQQNGRTVLTVGVTLPGLGEHTVSAYLN